MRTTLTIDDDVLAAARRLAERESKCIGEVISALARQGLHKGSRAARPVRKGGSPVTLELVNQLRDKQP